MFHSENFFQWEEVTLKACEHQQKTPIVQYRFENIRSFFYNEIL